MENNKSESNLWKYIGYILGGVVLLFVLVFLVNKLIITKAPFEVAQDNDWIGFWGGIVGAILSGVITFVVLMITISNENRKRLDDKDLIDSQRLDDRRMSILPYLTYSIAESIDGIEKELKSPLLVSPKINYGYTDKDGVIDKDKMCNIPLVIENLGLGIAIEPYIRMIFYDGLNISGPFRNMTVLNVGEKAFINLKVVLPEDEKQTLTLKIGYLNLLKDYYEQDIEFSFNSMLVMHTSENNIVEKITTKYHNTTILKISKAIMINEPE